MFAFAFGKCEDTLVLGSVRDEIESINHISINLPQSTKFSKYAPARTIVLAAIGKTHAKATFTLSGRGSDINYN